MTEQVRSKRVAGISARCSNDNSAAIGALWERFFHERVSAMMDGQGIYAVYFDYEGDHTKPFTLLLGAEIGADATLPEGLEEHVIEPGQYELYDASGPRPQSIIAGWQRVWASGVPRAYRTDFEMYGEGDVTTIFIGLKP